MLRVYLWQLIIVLTPWLDLRNAEIPFQKPFILNSFHKNADSNNLIERVTLTQRGYIQFLRYISEVPPINEFTFCIWLKSENFTYAHSLLSYSEHEHERYIRAWISPHGKHINLAILEKSVFQVPTYFIENRWYHICQSWEPRTSYWSFYLNGKLQASGYAIKLKDVVIPEGGDIVVGQEYTDFDKGLDDGIEGDIFGFNMVLASTTYTETSNNLIPSNSVNHDQTRHFNGVAHKAPQIAIDNKFSDVPSVLSYFTLGTNRSPKGFLDEGQTVLQNALEWFKTEPSRIRIKLIDGDGDEGVKTNNFVTPNFRDWLNRRYMSVKSDTGGINNKPLGLLLVELSQNCALGRGSPIHHHKMLVSWTKTPVRVYGGAILKTVDPFCFKL